MTFMNMKRLEGRGGQKHPLRSVTASALARALRDLINADKIFGMI